jgi:exopolysaccharide/PEP-CTERM locus tyrosine autokinase
MGKIHDALELYEKSKGKLKVSSAPDEPVLKSPRGEEEVRHDPSPPAVAPPDPSVHTSNDVDPRLITLLQPQSPEAEYFKLLRAKIFCTSPVCRAQVIMVTSAQPLDGKSTVASNLAVSIAQGINEFVLLMDCDLRTPSLHQMWGLEGTHGIREYLETGNSLSTLLLKTPVKKLTLFPAGRQPPNPSELLSSERMRLLIEEVKGRYPDRYIIIDTPPATFAAEGRFLADMVDGVLLVVRAGKTPKESILGAVENIGRDKLLGIVFNADAGPQKDFEYYYREYGKGRK